MEAMRHAFAFAALAFTLFIFPAARAEHHPPTFVRGRTCGAPFS
jgi:hypothetical protein